MFMKGFFASMFALFLSPFGLIALATLDSSMLFFLPAATDMAVIILTARYRDLFWIFPIMATAGSLIGSYITFWLGRKIGENSLVWWVSERRLKSIQQKVKTKGAVALAIPGLIPPPFPLTPFILVCGALKVNKRKFFLTLGSARLLRFSLGAVLSLIYGRRVVTLLESEMFQMVIAAFFVLAFFGTAYSTYRNIKTTRKYRAGKSHAGKAA
jgi:membrane protein YqaA with SNARE-associated domain